MNEQELGAEILKRFKGRIVARGETAAIGFVLGAMLF